MAARWNCSHCTGVQEKLRPGGDGVEEAFLDGEKDLLTLRCPRLDFSSFPLPSLCVLGSSQRILVKGPRESLERNSLTFRHATPRSKADRPRCSSLARSSYWVCLDGLFHGDTSATKGKALDKGTAGQPGPRRWKRWSSVPRGQGAQKPSSPPSTRGGGRKEEEDGRACWGLRMIT